MSDNRPLRTIIVDDEPLARRGLALRLDDKPEVEVIAECHNGRDAIDRITELRPDLVFLDIQMPGMDGFQVLRALPRELVPMVIFVTAYDEYAIRAFETHALDYILKPIDDSRLHQALYRVREQIQQKRAVAQKDLLMDLVADLTGQAPDEVEAMVEGDESAMKYPRQLVIRDGRRTVKVDVKDIDWIEAAGDYMCVHADGETHIMRSTMKALEEQLSPALFQRVHRSTIVNVTRVKELVAHMNGEYFLVLDSGDRLKLSRNYRDRVQHFVDDNQARKG